MYILTWSLRSAERIILIRRAITGYVPFFLFTKKSKRHKHLHTHPHTEGKYQQILDNAWPDWPPVTEEKHNLLGDKAGRKSPPWSETHFDAPVTVMWRIQSSFCQWLHMNSISTINRDVPPNLTVWSLVHGRSLYLVSSVQLWPVLFQAC